MNINMQTVSLYMQEREPAKQGEPGKADASANKKEGATNADTNTDIVKVRQAQKDKELSTDKKVSPEELKKDAEKKNTAFFAVDDSNNVVIKIVNGKGELIKQIPPEDYLKMVEKMEKNSGKLFHKEV